MRIYKKLIIVILPVVILPMLFAAAAIFHKAKTYLEKKILTELETVAKLKAEKIELFFSERKADVMIAAGRAAIRDNLPIIEQFRNNQDSPAYLNAKGVLDDQMGSLQAAYGYDNVMLLDKEGKLIYLSEPKHSPRELNSPLPELGGPISEKLKNGFYMSEVFKHSPGAGQEYYLLITAPVHDRQNEFIGVLVFGVDMDNTYRLLLDNTGLGKSGESLLVKKTADNKVLFISPLRYATGAALTKTVVIGSREAIPAQRVVSGEDGIGQEIDYRGEKVLSAWDYLPALGWGLICKADAKEVFFPITGFKYAALITLIVISALTAAAILSVAKFISMPIHALHKGTEVLATGNLDYKVGTKNTDEIGQLSRDIDKMAEGLKRVIASRDELNREIELRGKIEGALKKVNEELARSNTFNATLLKTIPFAMDIVDEHGNIIFINDKLRGVAGENREGKKCWELYRDDKKQCSGCPLMQGIKLGQTAVIEAEGCFGNKALQIFHTGMLYDGKPAILEIFQDITDRKQAEEALKKSNEKLKKIDQLKSDFVSTVSHELRTPLAIMKEGVSLVLDKITGAINEQQDKTLGMVYSNINRLSQLITDLLDISKIEAGRVQLKKSLVDAGVLVRDVSEKWRFESDKKGQKLQVVVPDQPVRIYLDNDKIIQVLDNLISNAIKYTPGSGLIKIELTDSSDDVELLVSDNGAGIAAEDLPHVFEKFQQFSRSPGAGAKGTGLGLAITKELVNLHEGAVTVESKTDQGASFRITLPKMDSETVFKQHIQGGIKEAADKNSHLSVVTVRISEFARLQKELGFDQTHAMLKEIENVINGALRRKADTVIRDTGELIVLLFEVDKASGALVKERISAVIQSFLDEKKDKALEAVTFNIGLAAYPEDAGNEEELLNKARGVIKAKAENA